MNRFVKVLPFQIFAHSRCSVPVGDVGRLLCDNTPQGCLLSCAYGISPQAIPEVCLSGAGLPVQGAAVSSLPLVYLQGAWLLPLLPCRPAVFQVCHSWTTCLLFLPTRCSVYLSSNSANPGDAGERSLGRPEITMDRSLLARQAMISCTPKQCCWEALGLHSLYIITQPVHMLYGDIQCFSSAIWHLFFKIHRTAVTSITLILKSDIFKSLFSDQEFCIM